MMSDKNRSFWEKMHKDNSRLWLTDSDPNYVYELHSLTKDLIRSKYNILEVGVGTGRSIIRLSDMHSVYAVDIAEEALKKVRLFATTIQVYDEENWPKDKIDIALCHLVFQHCNDNNFRYLIRQILESLTPKGYFTFQSADAEKKNLNKNYKKYVKENHMYFRSKDDVTRTVEKMGGRVLSISDDIVHINECYIVWNIFRVKRSF